MKRWPAQRRLPVLVALSACFALFGCSGPDSDLGERIYRDGRGEQGVLSYRQGPRWLAHGNFGCVTCHGKDGQGRVVQAGSIAGSAPPVTRAALRDRGYDDAGLRRAIIDGIAADGRTFSYYMPRWQLSEPEWQALLDYLAGL